MNRQRWFLVLSPDGAARSVSMHCAKAFELKFGSDCKTFDCLTYRNAFSQMQKHENDEMTVDLLNQSLIVSCLDFSATHILVMALSPVTVFALNLLRKKGVKTIHWFFEDFQRATYWKDVLAGYDHFCAIQRGPLPEACAASGAEYHFLPTATNMAIPTQNIRGDRPYEIGFIGIPSLYRISLLEFLLSKGLRIAIAGSGWNNYHGPLRQSIVKNGWVNEEEYFELLQRSKIGINISVDEPVDRALTHISPRVYDILIAGCALVSEEVPLLAESLPHCTYYTFDSTESAFRIIQKALSDCTLSLSNIEKNINNVVLNHTFEQRVEQLVKLC
jgi:hypothetical protein